MTSTVFDPDAKAEFWQLFGITKVVNPDWDGVLEYLFSPLCKRLQKHLSSTGYYMPPSGGIFCPNFPMPLYFP